MPTEPLTPPDQTEVDSWQIEERGVRDGGSPVESFEIDATSAERVFSCAWEHRHSVVEWFLGKQIVWDDAGTLRLSRLIPQKLPGRNLHATKIVGMRGHKWTGNAVEGDPYQFTDAQINEHHRAEFRVLYEALPFEVLDDEAAAGDEKLRFVQHPTQTEISGQYLTMPGASLYYLRESGTTAPHNQSIPVAPGKIIPGEVFRAVWRSVPDAAFAPDTYLWERIYGTTEGTPPMLGKINSHELFGRPPGTVLFSGVNPLRRVSALGDVFLWDIAFEFTYAPTGHNWAYYHDRTTPANSGWYFVGPKNGTVEYAGSLTDGNSIYDAADLRRLFSVAA